MQLLLRLALIWLVLFLVMYPAGFIYRRGKLGPLLGSIVGGVLGLIVGLLLAAPDFQPRSASIAAVLILTLLWMAVLPASLWLFGPGRSSR